jgi:tripartite-type tricarboxylate transporter receptor subunit TctC
MQECVLRSATKAAEHQREELMGLARNARKLPLWTAIVGALLAATPTAAQDVFPEPGRPITFISNFAPGGQVQKALMDFQPYFEEALGTRIVIETIEGAAGLIGYNSVYSREADGYTILPFSTNFGPHVYPYLAQTTPPWKYEDWVVLGIYADNLASGVVVTADSPYQGFTDLILAAREKPGEITIGTIGPGRVEDVQIAELQKFFGIEINHVYYDSGGTLFTDLLTGDLDAIITAALVYVDNPEARIITMLGRGMTENFPYKDLKTMADWQQDLNYNVDDLRTLAGSQFYGLVVKAGLPDVAYDKLVEVLGKVAQDPRWQEQVRSYRDPVWYPPEQAKQVVDTMREGIAAVVVGQ